MSGEVHVWQVAMEDAKPHADVLLPMLSSDEKARGERLINSMHRERFLLAQAMLRDILSRYINQAPETLRFTRGEHGKPYLLGVDLQFSLTHSCDRVLVAINTEKALGVDVEYLERTHRFDDLVARFFSKEEQQEYRLYTTEGERRLAFYRGWTRKEAYLKAIGLGLSYPLDQFAVSLRADETQALLRVENDTAVRAKWIVLSFSIDKDYLASLAIQAPVDKLQIYHWSFSSTP